MSLMDKVRSAAGAVADRVGEAYAGGVDMAQGMLADVTAASGDLVRAGYRVTDVEVQIGVPPGVTVFLVKERDATEEEFAAVLADHTDRTAARMLIQMVAQADRWAQRLWVGGRCFRQVAVDLGIRPGVRLLYPASPAASAVAPSHLPATTATAADEGRIAEAESGSGMSKLAGPELDRGASELAE
jgi:hypothetical protein